jgi:cyclopropane-fatty-acyl-phospholipid synthase
MATTQQRTTTEHVTPVGVAHRLESTLRPFVGGDLPVRLRAWDGSEAGPVDAPLVELRSQDAVRRLLWHPGELGAAQAYVTGEIEVHHDLDEALTHVWSVAAERGLAGVRPSPGAFVRALRAAVDVGGLGKAPAPPASQARVRGRLHSKLRDRRAISHHYDLSNEFYSLILDPSMAYSSGYWRSTDPSSDPEYGVAHAQRDKLDLVCQKVGLGPGMRFLDVGCGWGSLSLHAAEHYGAHVTGVTIAAEQKKFIDERVRERGLEHLVQIRLQDYREIPEVSSGDGFFDAVASIEMGEHVGEQNYGTYAQVLHDAVRPGGRVLVQQMSRAGGRNGHPGGGPFIESFIAPDMHMRPIGETVAYLERGGLEVRDVHGLREHYVLTVAGWLERFEANLERLTELVGEEVVRVWRLYLVGGAMAFRDGRMGVDQILMVRPGGAHTLPLVRTW